MSDGAGLSEVYYIDANHLIQRQAFRDTSSGGVWSNDQNNLGDNTLNSVSASAAVETPYFMVFGVQSDGTLWWQPDLFD